MSAAAVDLRFKCPCGEEFGLDGLASAADLAWYVAEQEKHEACATARPLREVLDEALASQRAATAAPEVSEKTVAASDLAIVVNDATARGATIEVGGREVWSRWSRKTPARAWQNGSVSVDVRGRTKGAQGTVWVRRGETATVKITEAGA